jgi:hypothetical protein
MDKNAQVFAVFAAIVIAVMICTAFGNRRPR